jgi:hypothetical protein
VKILQRGFTIVCFDDTLNISDCIFTDEKLKVLVFQKIISAICGPFVKLCTCAVQRKAHFKGSVSRVEYLFWRIVIIIRYFLIVLQFFVYLLMKKSNSNF